MQRLTDEEIIIHILDGHSEDYEIIVNRYQKQIFALAYRLGNDYDDAQDMAQEAFIRIYHELSRFNTSRRFFPWMYRIAYNTCLNVLRKRPKESLPFEQIPDLPLTDSEYEGQPAAAYDNKELNEEITKALSSLPEKYRAPLALKYLEGLSYIEIGAILDLPVSTIETRLFRGRSMLKKALTTYLRHC